MVLQIERLDVLFLKDFVESVETELEQLEHDAEWFANDLGDKTKSAKQILNQVLQGELFNVYQDKTED